MSSIPNLNTLRTGRGGPRLRGRRGGRAIPENDDTNHLSAEEEHAAKDRVVQQTDHDASSSRLSSVGLGYLDDQYARAFLQPGEQIVKRYPIINRGTYVRTTAIDRLVYKFLRSSPNETKQIISLGAGSDTRFFRLCDESSRVVYHEIDFEANTKAKQAALDRSPPLAQRLRDIRTGGSTYHLHSTDLRDLTAGSSPSLPGLERDLPTLILSECCLCYLPPESAAQVLAYFNGRFSGPVGIVIYEPIRPFDAFGKTMVSNLASRGIHMQTLKLYASLEAQRHRLRLAGFVGGQGARDVYQIWHDDSWTSRAEKERVERLEWLDEIEEWKLLASHYCVAWGYKSDLFANAWSDIEGGKTNEEDQYDDLG